MSTQVSPLTLTNPHKTKAPATVTSSSGAEFPTATEGNSMSKDDDNGITPPTQAERLADRHLPRPGWYNRPDYSRRVEVEPVDRAWVYETALISDSDDIYVTHVRQTDLDTDGSVMHMDESIRMSFRDEDVFIQVSNIANVMRALTIAATATGVTL